MERLKKFLEIVFLWRLLKKFLWRPFFFFWRALALVSLVLGLGPEHSCPWPRECLSSERLSLALASDFFCVLGLQPCVLDSTSDVIVKKFKKQWLDKFNVSCVLAAVPTNLLGKKDLLGLLLLIFDLRFKNYRPSSFKKWRKVKIQVRTGLWKTENSRL